MAPADPELEPYPPDDDRPSLRGGCLHTQPLLRRTTFRINAAADDRTRFAGTRLVLSPGKAAWE